MHQPSTEEIASYMKQRFCAELKGNKEKLDLPNFPLELLQECNFAMKLLAQAIRNQSKYFLEIENYELLKMLDRTDELVSQGIRDGVAAAEQALLGPERGVGARDAAVVSSGSGGATV